MRPLSAEPVFENPSFDGHEEVMFCHDRQTGLRALIAVHDTTLGVGLGGTRMWPYQNEALALRDALRLSEGMTWKNALAGLPLGGAKAVIIGDPARDKSEALLRAFAGHVARLGGSFVTAEDVGMGVADLDVMRTVTPYVRGTSAGQAGDPSPHTAFGVLKGIEAAARHGMGVAELAGVSVCIQGLGSVGMHLARHLDEAGARLVVADIRPGPVEAARARFGADVIPSDQAHTADVDIFAPCALGAVLNARTIPDIRARIVAGAANNQLETDTDGARLLDRAILYAPDYAINAGGVISIAHDTEDFDRKRLMADLARIGTTLGEIFRLSEVSGEPTSVIADRLALDRVTAGRAAAREAAPRPAPAQ